MSVPPDETNDLIGAYALDALGPDERTMVDNALAANPLLRSELASYHEVLAVLAQSVEMAPSTPSPGVWDGINCAIAGDRLNEETPEFTPARAVRRRRLTTRLLGVVAAGSLVVAAVLGIQLASVADPSLAAAADQLRSDPTATLVTLTDATGLSVDVVLGPDGVGYVYTDALPEIADGRTYQLWAINDTGVISAGIFRKDGIAPFHVDGAIAGLAITEEIAGGVVASENDPVALWLGA